MHAQLHICEAAKWVHSIALPAGDGISHHTASLFHLYMYIHLYSHITVAHVHEAANEEKHNITNYTGTGRLSLYSLLLNFGKLGLVLLHRIIRENYSI